MLCMERTGLSGKALWETWIELGRSFSFSFSFSFKSLSHVWLSAYSPWNPSLLQGIFPTQGLEPRSPALRADSLLAEPPGKPNTGMGSLSLPQQIFPTQGSNRGHLHCRRILYQLSYKHALVNSKVHVKACGFPLSTVLLMEFPDLEPY